MDHSINDIVIFIENNFVIILAAPYLQYLVDGFHDTDAIKICGMQAKIDRNIRAPPCTLKNTVKNVLGCSILRPDVGHKLIV